ncbi:MAG TPA: alpha/beta fold hydrolase [Dermatophilaceae bacterium]|nr:alpha/beta fold hydrolase [Dermatophilaceae bacterium]
MLALHGITATHMAWSVVAGLLPEVDLIAPDLRGRGRSAQLPGPYGFAAHAADMMALLDALDLDRVVVAGHSMGGFVAVSLASRYPDRVTDLVLVDGGLPVGRPEDPAPEGGIDALLGPAAARLAMTFPTRAAYHEFWRAHPAIGPMWGAAVQRYVDDDLIGEPPELRSSCREEAMRWDGAEVADNARNLASLLRVGVPLRFLRAPRGLLDGAPLYRDEAVRRLLSAVPGATWSTVPDTNHYSVLLGASGAAAVAGCLSGVLTRAGRAE